LPLCSMPHGAHHQDAFLGEAVLLLHCSSRQGQAPLAPCPSHVQRSPPASPTQQAQACSCCPRAAAASTATRHTAGRPRPRPPMQPPRRPRHLSPHGLLDLLGDPGRLVQVKAHVHLGVDLVHILAASTTGTRKAEVHIVCAGTAGAASVTRQQGWGPAPLAPAEAHADRGPCMQAPDQPAGSVRLPLVIDRTLYTFLGGAGGAGLLAAASAEHRATKPGQAQRSARTLVPCSPK
jgi:hypothetical protein